MEDSKSEREICLLQSSWIVGRSIWHGHFVLNLLWEQATTITMLYSLLHLLNVHLICYLGQKLPQFGCWLHAALWDQAVTLVSPSAGGSWHSRDTSTHRSSSSFRKNLKEVSHGTVHSKKSRPDLLKHTEGISHTDRYKGDASAAATSLSGCHEGKMTGHSLFATGLMHTQLEKE